MPILCLSARYHAPKELACIRCGRCVDACPMRLAPALIYGACRKNKEQRLARLNVDACIECGACAFVCPAHLPILEEIRRYKQVRAEAEKPIENEQKKEDAENAEAEA